MTSLFFHHVLLISNLIFFIDRLEPGQDIHQHRHHNAVACQLIQLAVGQTEFVPQFIELFVAEPHKPEAFLWVKPPDPAVMEDRVSCGNEKRDLKIRKISYPRFKSLWSNILFNFVP